MALTDAKEVPARRPLFRLPARLQTWLASEHAPAQRIAGAAFVIRVASAAIVFASQILLARWMGSSEFGLYVYAWTWLLVVGDIIHLGLPLTAQRHIPEYTQQNALDRLRGFLLGSRWLTFAMGTGVAVFGAMLVRSFESSLGQQSMPLYLACVALPFYTFSNMLDGMARSFNWINVALVPPYVLRPLILIAATAVAYASGVSTDASTAMGALAFATWTTALLQLVLLSRRIGQTVQKGPRTYDFNHWLRIAFPVLTVWAFYTLLTYTDVLVLKQFRPAGEVAHYYAASKTLALVAFIYFSVAAAVGHRFTALHVAGDREALAALVANVVRWTFWPSLAATALVLALGRPLLGLFGPQFVEAYPYMFVLALGLLARAAVGPAERLLNMLGEQRRCALIYATAFAANLAGCLALAPRFGAMGVAAATAGAIVIESSLLFLVARRRLGLHLFVWRPT
jgi:O-antigen/teichoic acid export membrane protein